MSISNSKYAIKAKTSYQRLDKLPVYLYDHTLTSPDYFVVKDLPDQFNAGKNIIKLGGSTNSLLQESQVKIELLSSTGEPIYLEYGKYVDRLGYRYITAYIYPDTAPGYAMLTIVGTAKVDVISNGYPVTIPAKWQNRDNLKWQKRIKIEPLERNNSDIIFSESPTVNISELFKSYNRSPELSGVSSISSIRVSSSAFISYQLISTAKKVDVNLAGYNLQYRPADIKYGHITYDDNYSGSFSRNNIPEFRKVTTDANEFENKQLVLQKGIVSPGGLGYVDRRQSDIVESGSALFTINGELIIPKELYTEMANGLISLNPSFTSITPPYGFGFVSSSNPIYYAEVKRVTNGNQLLVSPPYIRQIVPLTNPTSAPIDYIITEFSASEISMSYSTPTTFTSSNAYKNIAHIELNNINPLFGDVYKIRTYVKSNSDNSDYKLMSENILDGEPLFVDTGSAEYNLPIGDISSAEKLGAYWTSGSRDWDVSIGAAYSTSPFRSIRLGNLNYSGSGYVYILPHIPGSAVRRQFNFFTGNTYEFTADMLFDSSGSIPYQTTSDLSLMVFLSGSAFSPIDAINKSGSFGTHANQWITGKKILEINVPYNTSFKDFNRLSYRFTSDEDGYGTPFIIASAGYWYLSNIQLNSLVEPGYSPTFANIDVPVNPLWDNDSLDFKFEFLDYKGKASDQYLYMKNVPFQNGQATYIQGTYNLLTGSLYLSNAIGSGIELSGHSSGVIKSVGYYGYNSASNSNLEGFAIWSGSISLGNESYSGVGIEMHTGTTGSYFQYRDKKINLKTDLFDTSYITSSIGSIDISSSVTIHGNLSVSGNLYATSSNAVTASYSLSASYSVTASYVSGGSGATISANNMQVVYMSASVATGSDYLRWVSGSNELLITGSIRLSGTMYGTSSWAENSISSSFSTSASNAATSSYTLANLQTITNNGNVTTLPLSSSNLWISNFTGSATERLISHSGSAGSLNDNIQTDSAYITDSSLQANLIQPTSWSMSTYIGSTTGAVEGQVYIGSNYRYEYQNSTFTRYDFNEGKYVVYTNSATASVNDKNILCNSGSNMLLWLPAANTMAYPEIKIKNINLTGSVYVTSSYLIDGTHEQILVSWNTMHLLTSGSDYLII